MKKNYFLHTAILLVALVCGSVPVWSQTYKKISSIEELTDGKYVIAYENMAMENTGLCFMFHVEHWVMFLHLCFT